MTPEQMATLQTKQDDLWPRTLTDCQQSKSEFKLGIIARDRSRENEKK